MEVCVPYTDMYLLTLTFYAEDYPVLNQSGAVNRTQRIPTHTVRARVTNTENRRLTLQNLQCVSLSFPDLYYRLTGHLYAPALLHLAQLQIDPLPSDSPRPTAPTPRPDPSSRRRTGIGRVSPDHSSVAEEQAKDSQRGRRGESRDPDWLRCDGSFVPSHSGKEWTSVNYRGREFRRAFSRVIWKDEVPAEILGRCNISDYTVYEQFVLSVDVDILLEPDSEIPVSPSERTRYQDVRDDRPPRQSRKRHLPELA